ncbi:hypothetical protein [Phytomonospora endophytica]|uniref:Uncharacterized protein n=1 Tax=Phytomonospora endophytica TaxID=714109 RepID=A0A841FU58_9ACTN|nr:hypothetical protein [Phytomonospora endophytica]MBB6039324.1 hypothetical protein [Phytomonospora endophytica]GIG69734.1 hypothetical protein Pen01_60290 [Phytomonospora endophytica]
MAKKSAQRDALPGLKQRPAGRTERAVGAAITAGQRAKTIQTVADGPLAATARTLARLLDAACLDDDRWAAAKLAAELRATLADLGLTPAARGASAPDRLTELLEDLGKPDAVPGPAALRHRP